MPEAEIFEALVGPLHGYLLAASLAMARGLGLVVAFPVFSRLGLVGILRSGLALGLSFPLLPLVLTQVETVAQMEEGLLALLIAKEVLLGVILGLAFGLPFWAVEVTGDVLDYYRGSSMAYLIDPGATDQASLLGTLLLMIMVALFFLIDGFNLVVDGLYRSFSVWPIMDLTPRIQDAGVEFLLQMLDSVVRIGIVFAGPLLIAMFLGELGLALTNRFAPNLNVFDLSLSVKNLILLLVFPIYAIFLLDYMKYELAALRQVLDTVRLFVR